MRIKRFKPLGLGFVILLTIIVSLTLFPIVRAASFYDENNVMQNVSTMHAEGHGKYTGVDSILMRGYIDYAYGNYDGNLTQAEVDNYKNWFQNDELGKVETQYTFIDGIRGRITSCVEEISCPLGDINTPGDYTSLITDTITWTLEERTTHTYERSNLQDGNTISFMVPSGWEIVTAEGLSSKSISVDKRTVTGTAITNTSHIITFAMSATFQISGLSISPSHVDPNQPVTIAFNLANNGGVQGAYTVALKVDNVVENTREVTLAGGENTALTFFVTKSGGKTYNVEVGGASGTFTVRAPTSVSCSVSSNKIEKGKTMSISGSISPSRAGVIVTITCEKPDGSTENIVVESKSDGSFELSYSPENAGSWNVTASLEGDNEYLAASSSPINFMVEEKFPIILLILGAVAGIAIVGVAVFFVRRRG